MSKITMATIKAFIRRAGPSLRVSNHSNFDPMEDCVKHSGDRSFSPVVPADGMLAHTLGVGGARFVGGSRDFLSRYEHGGLIGYTVSNCCGSFTLATRGPP